MIGIPAAETPEFVSFSASFWAGLYSGLIYSIFTGIIVGLVIWRMQIAAENRIRKQKFEDEVNSLKEKLRQVNFGQNPLIITSATKSFPQAATEIIKLIDGKPIAEWAKKLKKHKRFIEKLIELQKQKLEFDKLAGQLDNQLSQFIRSYNAKRKAISVNDPAHISHFMGRLHGFRYDQIKQWLDSGNQETLEQSWQNAQNETKLTANTQPYLNARNQIIEIVDSISIMVLES